MSKNKTPACTGSCNQSRASCPHPEACCLPEDDPHEGWGAWVVPVVMVGCIAAVALLWHLSGYLSGVK